MSDNYCIAGKFERKFPVETFWETAHGKSLKSLDLPMA